MRAPFIPKPQLPASRRSDRGQAPRGRRGGLAIRATLAAILLALAAPATARAEDYLVHDFVGASTLLVGDSHTWIVATFVDGEPYSGLDVDAQPGRTSTGGVEVVEDYLRPRHERVIFDLATNDYAQPEILRTNLQTLRRLLDGRELVLVNSYRTDTDISPINRTLWLFTRSHRHRTTLVRWHAIARRHASYMSADRVHFTAEGYDRRRRLIERAAVHPAEQKAAERERAERRRAAGVERSRRPKATLGSRRWSSSL